MAANILQRWGGKVRDQRREHTLLHSERRGEETMGEMQLSWQPWWAPHFFFFNEEGKIIAMCSGKIKWPRRSMADTVSTQLVLNPQLPCYLPACPTLCYPWTAATARLPCPSSTPRACSNSCPLSWWCHPTISSSIVPFSSCLLSFPSIRVFSNELPLCISWPKYWSFNPRGWKYLLYQTYLQQGNIGGILLGLLRKLIFFLVMEMAMAGAPFPLSPWLDSKCHSRPGTALPLIWESKHEGKAQSAETAAREVIVQWLIDSQQQLASRFLVADSNLFKPPKDLLDFVSNIAGTEGFKVSGKHLSWSLKRIGEEKEEHRIIDNNEGSDEVKLF